MSISDAKRKAQKVYQYRSKQQRTSRPLNSREFRLLLRKFYAFAAKHGFYRSIDESIEKRGFFIFQFQEEIGVAILRSLFQQRDIDLNISVLRQVGKTEFVSLTTAFAFERFYDVFFRPLEIAVIAPEKDTAGVVFRRITKYINPKVLIQGGDTKKYKESVKGDTIQLFGIYDEYKGSTIEGRSFDMVIRDEAHLGNDRKFVDEVEPTMMSKRGPLVMIGNGGFKKCVFQEYINEGSKMDGDHETILVRYTYKELKPYLQQLADKGIEAAKTRISKIERYIRKHGGLDSKEVLKNIYCKWMLEYSNAITHNQISQCYGEVAWDGGGLYMGLDFATMHDRTIATIMDENRQIIDWFIIKDANVQMRAREQGSLLREYCDEAGYTPHILAIGFDATGVGSGGIVEILEDEFKADILPYVFSGKMKHEWYMKSIEMMATSYDEDRLSFNPNHPCAPMFEEEWTSLERTELPKQKYCGWAAPNRVGCYDDFVASLAICVDVITGELSNYKKLDSYSERWAPKKEASTEGRFDFLRSFTEAF